MESCAIIIKNGSHSKGESEESLIWELILSKMAEWKKGDLPMFQIGDRIVYPMHGAGIIRAVEEKAILGEKQSCYILKIAYSNMDVMIPVSSAEKVGMREIGKPEDVEQLFSYIKDYTYNTTDSWNKRYRENLDKIRSGDMKQIAEVLKYLMYREEKKPLSSGEKKMLQQAKQILYSEIVLIKDITQEETEAMFKECIGL